MNTTDRWSDAQAQYNGAAPRVEIIVQDVDGAKVAREEGADRVELCTAMGATGGITPSFGLIQLCSHVGVRLGVQARIRSRGGNFVYDEGEKRVMLADVRSSILAGASGVVVGALDKYGNLDVAFAKKLYEAAKDEGERCGRHVSVTFNRAFDMVNDPFGSLDILRDMGYTRVLTSGGASRVQDGLGRLHELVCHAAGRIDIMAVGHITPDLVRPVLDTGVPSIHLSARVIVASDGGPGGSGDDPVIERTDREWVRAVVNAVHGR
ncbi:copper homeostasis protein CutC [Bifidobacterium avesanii]|uniref:PF03932 family protein CutC n=1 Tax=Bifidobacterium avesanii TaxID=1798157 RepID=A0A7K3TJU6_9BIFI|nr:copper homeostasis protein CutC [Bifidobacterium avesanii]KAB8287554.1 copper homeostasis protein [Bifidobacterium avesanii]NEG79312.1 copper homeostasis protein CutC [Bifidobacterium avesanii]